MFRAASGDVSQTPTTRSMAHCGQRLVASNRHALPVSPIAQFCCDTTKHDLIVGGDVMADAMHDTRQEGDSYRRIEVITGQRRRRRWMVSEKARIVAEGGRSSE